MNKITLLSLLLIIASGAASQATGRVDKKTKEFSIPSNLKTDYRIFGYQFGSLSSRKMICFSSHSGDVTANYSECPLGSYYDTQRLKPGERIVYLGPYGAFAKMKFVADNKKETVFYLPKDSFVMN